MNIPIGLVGFAVIALVLGPLVPEKVRRFDIVGAGLLAAWVGALMYPLYQIADAGWGWTDPVALALIAAAGVLVVVFVVWEYRNENPLVPVRLFLHRVVAAGGGGTFFIGMVFFPVATFLSLVVGEVLTPASANPADTVRDILYFLVVPLVIGAALGGQLLTRLSYRTVAVVGIIIACVGMAGLSGLSVSTPLWTFAWGVIPTGGIIVWLMPLGFGIGLTFPVFLLAAQNQVEMADVGEAGGLIQFLQSLGGAIGLSVLSSFQQTQFTALGPVPMPACYGPSPPPDCASYLASVQSATIASYDQTFLIMLALLVLAFAFILFLRGSLPRAAAPTSGAATGEFDRTLPLAADPPAGQEEVARLASPHESEPPGGVVEPVRDTGAGLPP